MPNVKLGDVADTNTDGTKSEIEIAAHLNTLPGIATRTVDVFWRTDNPDTRGQTIADGVLTVVGREYGSTGMPVLDAKRDDGEDLTATTTPAIGQYSRAIDTTDSANPVFFDEADPPDATQFATNNTVNNAKYRTHKIDLASAVEAGVKWANGEKHVDVAKAAIEKALRILESDIGLDNTTKTNAWKAVQNAIADNLFAQSITDLGDDLSGSYNARNNSDFVRAAAEALEALANADAFKAALAEGGIFDGLANPANGKSNEDGTDGVALFARVNSRLGYAIGSTDFTRFGAWHRQTSKNAEDNYTNRGIDRSASGITGEDNETAQGDRANSLAYSQLAPTSYQSTPLDPRFPAGARLTYKGSTIAVFAGLNGATFFEGAVGIDVLWDSNAIGGSASMSISDFENMADASPLFLDLNTGTNAASNENDLLEVASITINNLTVTDKMVLRSTDVVNNLDSGGAAIDSTTSVATVSAIRPGTLTPVRGTIPLATTTADRNAVDGQFVGQAVSGPLAVLGTWEVTSNVVSNVTGSSDITAGAIGAKVEHRNNKGVLQRVSVTGLQSGSAAFTAGTIHGGFGAELP